MQFFLGNDVDRRLWRPEPDSVDSGVKSTSEPQKDVKGLKGPAMDPEWVGASQ